MPIPIHCEAERKTILCRRDSGDNAISTSWHSCLPCYSITQVSPGTDVVANLRGLLNVHFPHLHGVQLVYKPDDCPTSLQPRGSAIAEFSTICLGGSYNCAICAFAHPAQVLRC